MKHWKNTTCAWVAGTAAFLSSAAVFGVAPPNTPPTTGTAVGQLYPDFYLPKIDGSWGRLSDFRGRKILLIHFASW